MPHTVEQMGYDEAVLVGTAYAQQLGYPQTSVLDVSPVTGTNVWRVRFGLPRTQGRRMLQLELDGTSRTLTKHEEVGGISARFQSAPVGPTLPNPR